jgi:20S proteasome subunit beta 6
MAQLTPKSMLVTAGMFVDAERLRKLLAQKVTAFSHAHERTISVEALAQSLTNLLYSNRFSPLYTFNILVGIDKAGKGAIYGYDALGSTTRSNYSAVGSSSALAMSTLDSLIARKNWANSDRPENSLPPREEAIAVAKDVLATVAERDVSTGDSAHIWVLDSQGVEKMRIPLRGD